MTTTGDRVRLTAERIRHKQGIAISNTRKSREMSAANLARALTELGIKTSDAAVSQWETGKTSPRQVTQLAIAKVLDVPWSTLFSLDGEQL